MTLRSSNSGKSEKGQSLVELAIGITILLLLLSGIYDVGSAIFTTFALQDAAEEGLIYGIGNPKDCGGIIARINNNLENRALPTSPEILISINGSACTSAVLKYGYPMSVVVSSPYVMTMPFFSGNTIPLRGTANGTLLRPPPDGS